MPLTSPSQTRDRTEDWLEFWNARRRDAIRSLVTPDLLEEHRRDVTGARKGHSAALQKVLNYVRNLPTEGKQFIYAEQPFGPYRIATMSPRNESVALSPGPTYDSVAGAEHEIFLSRLRGIGVELPETTT